VDTTKTATHVSLCAGYGGIDLGLKRAIPSLRTIAFSEIEAFACANLVAKMEAGLLDPAPVWTDLKTFPWDSFRGKVDILSGGYPCQPFSSAGKRLGKDDPRHLWPYIAGGIRILQPALCFFENVEGHITLGLRDVLDDLGGLGYRTTWGIFSASEVGAPHQRKMVFILAHRSGAGLPRHWGLEHVGLSQGRQAEEGCATEGGESGSAGILWPSRPGQPQFGWEPPRVVATLAHSTSVRCGERQHTGKLVESSEAKQEYEQGVSANSFVCCDSDAIVGLANATGERGGGQSGDALHQGRTTSEAGPASLSKDAQRKAGAAIADHQSAGGNGEPPRVVGDASNWQDDGRESRDLGQETSGREGGNDAIDCSSQGVGNAKGQRPSTRWTQYEGLSGQLCSSGTSGAMGNASQYDGGHLSERHRAFGSKQSSGRQTQPALGRNADGPAGRLDYAQLRVACDNRTDELRLLGNGVVPATAERAFTTLLQRLLTYA